MVGNEERSLLAEPDPERSWVAFLSAYEPTVQRVARRVVGNEEESRNVATDVLVRLRQDWPQLIERYVEAAARAQGSFRVWLSVVVRNVAIDVLRSRHGRAMTPRPIARLPAWQQRLWRLVQVDGATATDAAEVLRSEEGWTGDLTDLFRALEEVRDAHPASSIAGSIRRPSVVALGAEPDAAPSGDGDGDPASTARRRSTHAELRKILGDFSPEERRLLRLYGLERASAVHVAEALGLDDAERVYDRFRRLLVRLRSAAEARGLGPSDMAHLSDFNWMDTLGPREGER